MTEDDDAVELDVNIEGNEDFIPTTPDGDDSYLTGDEELEEELDYESFQLDEFQEDLELDDFNDEH